MSPRGPVDDDPVLRALLVDQLGVLSRSQLLDRGLTSAESRRDLENGRWRTLLPGVYAGFTGAVGPAALVWAAILYAGPGAVAAHRTALWLAGALDEPVTPIHVAVPHARRADPQPGVRVHLSRALDDPNHQAVHPSATPPRARVEHALLDVCNSESAPMTTHLVLSAIQRRLTTAGRLRRALAMRARHRWRRLIHDVLDEARDGVASPLELRYVRTVERAHRLPLGVRNGREAAPHGLSSYRDVRYQRWNVIVELDGREAHPADQAFRDMRRDNLTALAGETVLRYGWRDVAGRPCAAADQVGYALTRGGWTGRPERCGPTCTVS